MKKILGILVLLNYSLVLGQFNTTSTSGLSDLNGVFFKSDVKKIQGSPYFNKQFVYSKIGENFNNVFLRYNAYKDEFEFIDKKSDTLILNKAQIYGDITLIATKTNYKLLDYNLDKDKKVTGYLIVLHKKENYTLYKREKVLFFDEKPAIGSYDSGTPARYLAAKDKFYFKNNEDGIFEFPNSKKALIKLFPDRKTEIEAFFKKNSINFEDENDLKKLIDFLAS